MRVHPIIGVKDVEASTLWYEALLACDTIQGDHESRKLLREGLLLLQLHAWRVHDHPNLGDPDAAAHGYGVLLWFQTDVFDKAAERARRLEAEIVDGPLVNAEARHRELWLRDPDGYVIVLASAPGDVGRPA